MLVIIKDARDSVKVIRIPTERLAGTFKKMAQVICLTQQRKVVVHQFGRPQRLKVAVVDNQTLLDISLFISKLSTAPGQEDLVLGKT